MLLKSDSRIKSTIAVVKARQAIKTERLLDEITALHKRMPERKPIPVAMAKAQMQLSADRSRIAAIKMIIVREKVFLMSIQSRLDAYLRSKYVNFLDKHNIPTQRSLVEDALEPINRRISSLENAQAVIDICVEDFDKAAWSYKGVTDSLVLAESR